MYFYSYWFENASFLEVSDFGLVNVDPGPELSLLVGDSELDEDVDRVHARVFGQRCRQGFEGFAEGYNRQLFFSGEFLRMFSEASSDFCFWGTPASHDSWVKYNVAHNAQCVVNRSFSLVNNSFAPTAHKDRDSLGILASFDKRHLVV